MSKRHRSAVTGEYVSEAEAKADPERTVSEALTVKIDASELADLLDQISMEYANHLAALHSQVQALEAAVAELRGNQQAAGPSTEVAGGCQEEDGAA